MRRTRQLVSGSCSTERKQDTLFYHHYHRGATLELYINIVLLFFSKTNSIFFFFFHFLFEDPGNSRWKESQVSSCWLSFKLALFDGEQDVQSVERKKEAKVALVGRESCPRRRMRQHSLQSRLLLLLQVNFSLYAPRPSSCQMMRFLFDMNDLYGHVLSVPPDTYITGLACGLDGPRKHANKRLSSYLARLLADRENRS